jgi:hypothetical protein
MPETVATTSTNIVERLRAAADKSENGEGEWFQLVHRCREAADYIESKTKPLVGGGLLEDLLLSCQTMQETMKRQADIIDLQRQRITAIEERLDAEDDIGS